MSSQSGNTSNASNTATRSDSAERTPYQYALRAGDVIAGCRIVKAIGHGGMGEIYQAEHIKLEAKRAIKIIRPDIVKKYGSTPSQFLKEAKLQTHLEHPNIIMVHDVGFDETYEVYYIIMEFIEGEAVSARIRSGSQYTEREALEVTLRVAETLGNVNYKGHSVVHRDIKPDNIMLTPDGKLKVADWGIAMLEKRRIPGNDNETMMTTGNHGMKGTPAYMSPEQIADSDNVDCRADIYSLGVTLYEMLSGEKPFKGQTTKETLKLAISQKTPNIRKKAKVTRMTAKLLEAMMAKLPEDRIETWDSLVRRINIALEHLPSTEAEKRNWFARLLHGSKQKEEQPEKNQTKESQTNNTGKWQSITKKVLPPVLLIAVVLFIGFSYFVATASDGTFKEIRLSLKFHVIPKEYHPVFFQYGIEPPNNFLGRDDEAKKKWVKRYLPEEASKFISYDIYKTKGPFVIKADKFKSFEEYEMEQATKPIKHIENSIIQK
jgi:serine/threonine protein kinase